MSGEWLAFLHKQSQLWLSPNCGNEGAVIWRAPWLSSSQWLFQWQSSVVDLSLLRCFVVHPTVFPLRSRSTTAGDWLWLIALFFTTTTLFVLPPCFRWHHTLSFLFLHNSCVFALLTHELCCYRLDIKWFGFMPMCLFLCLFGGHCCESQTDLNELMLQDLAECDFVEIGKYADLCFSCSWIWMFSHFPPASSTLWL